MIQASNAKTAPINAPLVMLLWAALVATIPMNSEPGSTIVVSAYSDIWIRVFLCVLKIVD